MNDDPDMNHSDWPLPAHVIEEGEFSLAFPEPSDLPTPRLRGPDERAPTRAQVRRFIARTAAKRARTTNRLRLAVRQIAARRASRRRRVRRARSVFGFRTSARGGPPEPPADSRLPAQAKSGGAP